MRVVKRRIGYRRRRRRRRHVWEEMGIPDVPQRCKNYRTDLILLTDDADFPPLGPPSRQASLDLRHVTDFRISTPPVPPGFESKHASRSGSISESRRSTPTIPPGLTKPLTAVPQDLEGGSRPSSRASVKRTASSQIQPALPLRPATPLRVATPTPSKQVKKKDEVETPTKVPKANQKAEVASGEEKTVKAADLAKAVEEQTAETSSTKQDAEDQTVETHGTKQDAAAAAASSTPAQIKPPTAKDILTFREKIPNAKNLSDEQISAAIVTRVQQQPAVLEQQATHGPASTNEIKAMPITPTKSEPTRTDTHRRKAPGKLDIAAATKKSVVEAPSSTPAESSAKGHSAVAPTPSAASIPASPSISSPAVKAAPKTLRVVQTPKPETPPSATFASVKDQPAPATKLPSRQPSVASINLPGTPSSEQVSISDNLSVTSTSQSRANSPPPGAGPSGKVGSAPVRPKTKSQLKKERQEKAKAVEAEKKDEISRAIEEEEETAQEAIISRKKKEKKAKEPKGKARAASSAETAKEMREDSSPTKRRAASQDVSKLRHPPLETVVDAPPVPLVNVKATQTPVDRDVDSQPTTPEIGLSSTVAQAPAPAQVKRARQPKSPRSPPAGTAPVQFPHELSPPPTPTLTAAQLLADIKASTPAEIQKCIDSLFRSPASNHYKPTQPILPKDLTNPAMWEHNVELNLTKAEVDALLKGGRPSLHYGGHGGRMWDRGMVTNTGAHLRALTLELETRFLELEKVLKEMPEASKFHPSKPQNEMKFPHIDLEALRRQFEDQTCGRGLSVMEQMVQDGSMTKKGAFLVDEASKYINEFVMPPATPPPSAGGQVGANGAANMAAKALPAQAVELSVPSVDIAERQLNEAKRVADERDVALKKAMKKNKKILGLG